MSRNRLFIIGGVALLGLLAVLLLLVANINAVLAWVGGALGFIIDPNRIDRSTIIQCSESAACSIWHPIIFGVVLILIIVTGFAYTTLLERKFIAWFQQRSGPNRVGPGGLMQPAADAIKLIFKEDIIPDGVDKPVYYLAPLLKAIPVLVIVAVVPFGPNILIPWFAPSLGDVWYSIPLGMATNLNVGVLWILGITSLATYGIVLAGWSSNNKYATLGGLRSSAQMISYELSFGLALAVPVIIVGSMSMTDIINAQRNVWEWFVFQNPLAAGILMITMFAEVSRAPFDLPEAEQELTAGYMTEYSGMKFALFMMAEYIGMIAVSVVVASMFFGGYHIIPVDNAPILGPLFMIGKVIFFLILFIWVRSTLPRVRYDRLMALGWKVLLPLALVSIAWTSIAVVIGDAAQSGVVYALVSGIFFVVIVAGGYFFLRDSGESSEDDAAMDLANDPIVTGERNGLGWALLNLLGGLIAIPFLLIGSTVNLLEGLGKAGEDPSDETAIEPVKGSGGD